MKKTLLVFLFLPMIGFGQQTYVPDDNFEAYLESNGMGNGIANDDYVTTSNINMITYLNVNSTAIINLTGIEDFTNLIHLECWGNQLTTLDISQNTALNSLLCHANQLTALDVSQNTALIELNCIDNQLTSLDLRNNTSLNYLYCYNNLTLYCIDVNNVAWANSNWTSINNNIDSTVSFSINCANALGCTDSLACNYNFSATINDATCSFNIVWQQSFSICDGDIVMVGTSFYDTTGNYIDTLSAVNGCDSIVYTNISIDYNTSSYDTLSVAASIAWNGTILNKTGDYSVILTNSVGCDSIVSLNLTVTTSGISDIANNKSLLIKITDMLGKETPYRKNTPLFYIYDDGTVEQRIIVE